MSTLSSSLSRLQAAGRRAIRARPLTVMLPVTVLTDLSIDASQHAIHPDEESQLEELRDTRRRKLEAVKVAGGHAAGTKQTPRQRVRWAVEGWQWQATLLITALVDVAMLIVELSNTTKSAQITVATVTSIVLLIFVVDLLIRYYVFRCRLFTSCWFWFDFSIVTASVVMFIIGLALNSPGAEVGSSGATVARGGKALRGLIVALRWVRASRFTAKLALTATQGSQTAARHVTGENKKRFVDLENGFDLDLAYVLPDLIAMSVPATGLHALYRNPLPEVARFLETRHGQGGGQGGGYSIINCCPELPYGDERFVSGEVVKYDIQDHTPPTMQQFVDFLNSMHTKPASRTLAIHCRGGKGRTGSMCCAWLLYSRACLDADDALTHFALERTELSLGQKKIQGVDTPSQRRYVHQLDALLRAQAAYLTPPGTSRRASSSRGGAAAATVSSTADVADAGGGGGGDGGTPTAAGALVRSPACPTLKLASLDLDRWYAKPPKGMQVCAVHRNSGPADTCGKVLHWSAPLTVDQLSTISFDLGGIEIEGDVRISVFDLDDLVEERRRRHRQGCAARLPFDAAPSGPWGDTEDDGSASGKRAGHRKDAKRVIAGKETGCKFFLLFHTGFVAAEGALLVPLAMMDKAFKNKKAKYNLDAKATLRFAIKTGDAAEGAIDGATGGAADRAADGVADGATPDAVDDPSVAHAERAESSPPPGSSPQLGANPTVGGLGEPMGSTADGATHEAL